MVWNFEGMVPEMANYDGRDLPLKDMIFQRENLLQNYKTLLKPGENFDINKIVNNFNIRNDFNIVLLADMSDPDTDDEIIQMLLDEIPNSDTFRKVYILPENK